MSTLKTDNIESLGTGRVIEVDSLTDRQDLANRVIRVTSIAAMEAYSAPVGYVFSLNAGARSGTFDVVAGDFSTELAADTLNGVYIGLSDNPTATTKVARRRVHSFISVTWFGAKGDGVTDDTASCQAAIDFAGDNYTTSTVKIPPSEMGSYQLTLNYQAPPSGGSYHDSALLLLDGVTLDATGATIAGFKNLGTHGGFVSFARATDAHVLNGTWVGDKLLHTTLPAGEWCFAFTFGEAAKSCSLRNAVIKNSRGDGAYIAGPGSTFDNARLPTDIQITGNTLLNCGRNAISIAGGTGYLVSGNIIDTVEGYSPEAGIDIEPNYTYLNDQHASTNGIVSNNTIRNTKGSGLAIYRSKNVSIFGNVLYDIGGTGIVTKGNLNNVSITDNTVRYCGLNAGTDASNAAGLSVDAAAGASFGLLIKGNNIEAARCFDIELTYLTAPDTAEISGNYFSVTNEAADKWGSIGTGTATPGTFYESKLSSLSDVSLGFNNNRYEVLSSSSTFNGVTGMMLIVRQSEVNNNTFYSLASDSNKIRLDDIVMVKEFNYNTVQYCLVGTNLYGYVSSSDVDFARSTVGGSARPSSLFVLTNTPALLWPFSTLSGSTYEYAYGIVNPSDTETYSRRISIGGAWQYSGLIVS